MHVVEGRRYPDVEYAVGEFDMDLRCAVGNRRRRTLALRKMFSLPVMTNAREFRAATGRLTMDWDDGLQLRVWWTWLSVFQG